LPLAYVVNLLINDNEGTSDWISHFGPLTQIM